MLKFKNVVIVLIALLLILGIGMQVMATDSTIDLDNLGDLLNNTNSTNTANEVTNIVSENEVANETATNTAGTIVQPDTNEEETSSENDLPQTGVTEDITVMFFIVVCAISAIYAYKKIRDYRA